MKFLKAIGVLLAITLTLAGCKGGSNTTSEQNKANTGKIKSYITLLYSASDTFNPYTANTDTNRQLCRLIYEPLVKTDNEYNAVYCLAQTVTTEGKSCTVVLKDTLFSDGSSVTADDVVYSYNLAKNSQGLYASKLYEAAKAVAIDKKTISFTLTKSDPYFENVLDFPIMKSGSDKLYDSDSVNLPPIGSGKYKVSDDSLSLVQNQNYYGKKGTITEIRLINAPDSDSASHYVEIGATDIYYSDISDGEILRMSGQKYDINLNNLVYIGINHGYGDLITTEMRQALSSGLNRKKICQNAYYNNAVAATGFYNPAWGEVKSLQNIQIETNYEITVENLEKIGYNDVNSSGQRTKNGGWGLNYTLLVNSENSMRVAAAELIAEQLSGCGISITVIKRPYEQYLSMLQSGNFQLYLGEIKITENMDLTSLVTQGGSAAYGVVDSNTIKATPLEGEQIPVVTLRNLIDGFYSGTNTIADVATALQSEMPVIPVCYRTGVLFCNENIENVNSFSASDIYLSIEAYNVYK